MEILMPKLIAVFAMKDIFKLIVQQILPNALTWLAIINIYKLIEGGIIIT